MHHVELKFAGWHSWIVACVAGVSTSSEKGREVVKNARGRTADRDSFPSSSRGHRVDAHLSHSFFSYPFKLLPHSSAHLLQVMHCVVFRFYWLKVRSLAESHNWLELDKFSKARKSLIGYEVTSLTRFSVTWHQALDSFGKKDRRIAS